MPGELVMHTAVRPDGTVAEHGVTRHADEKSVEWVLTHSARHAQSEPETTWHVVMLDGALNVLRRWRIDPGATGAVEVPVDGPAAPAPVEVDPVETGSTYWEVGFRVVGPVFPVVVAGSEDEAIDRAWRKVKASHPGAEIEGGKIIWGAYPSSRPEGDSFDDDDDGVLS